MSSAKYEAVSLMPKAQNIRQSICAVCGGTIRPGAGVVLRFGAGGRVHAQECLAVAQNRLALKKSGAVDQLHLIKTSETA